MEKRDQNIFHNVQNQLAFPYRMSIHLVQEEHVSMFHSTINKFVVETRPKESFMWFFNILGCLAIFVDSYMNH